MPVLHMMVGVPCSGKSTLVKRYRTPFTVVASTDDIIEWCADYVGVTYSDIFKDAIGFADKLMKKRVSEAVNGDRTIIWDQTNLTRKTRAQKLELIPKHYETFAHYVEAPSLNVLLDRNDRRLGKTLSPDLITSMLESIEPPQLSEGFDTVCTYRTDGSVHALVEDKAFELAG